MITKEDCLCFIEHWEKEELEDMLARELNYICIHAKYARTFMYKVNYMQLEGYMCVGGVCVDGEEGVFQAMQRIDLLPLTKENACIQI